MTAAAPGRQDLDHALQRIPGGDDASGTRRPLIVTPVDFGSGHVIRCPWCNAVVAFREEWLGRDMPCPAERCGAPWKVNPFVCQRPAWAQQKR